MVVLSKKTKKPKKRKPSVKMKKAVKRRPAKKKALGKKSVKKTVKRKIVRKAVPKRKEEKPIGKVVHYFDKIKVAVIRLNAPLKLGEEIRIVGGETDFTQTVTSMEIEHEKIRRARVNQEIGVKVSQRARDGYRIFRV